MPRRVAVDPPLGGHGGTHRATPDVVREGLGQDLVDGSRKGWENAASLLTRDEDTVVAAPANPEGDDPSPRT